MITKTVTSSSLETIRVGRAFASSLKKGDVVLLIGELGSGKTHFVKGVALGMGISEEEVMSPTFSLVHEYQGKLPIYHLDCYRLKNGSEAEEIGLEEYLYGEGVCLIEWPGVIQELLPPQCHSVEIKHIDEKKREISIQKKG